MIATLHERASSQIEDMKNRGVYKELRYLTGPMDARAEMEGWGDVLILSSNNYLGLSNHPEVIQAGREALKQFGAGTASVRFICGTFTAHRDLEQTLARFLRTEAALSYGSCWTANTGAIPLLAGQDDAIVSDELNHASIIDGVRMSQAKRYIYKHSDMSDLEAKLERAASERGPGGITLICTDGVFSMEGDLALLPAILDLAESHDAATFVDDSHGTGVVGEHGRGIAEHFGVEGRVDVISGTLGKALGGAAGGFIASSAAVVSVLTQSSRPQIFSNALPTTIAASARRAIELLESDRSLIERLRYNTAKLRKGLETLGFHPLPGDSAIIPIIVGETAFAIKMSARLLEDGVFVTGFGYPVVPEGAARIRVQSSAALKDSDIERALTAFETVGRQMGLI